MKNINQIPKIDKNLFSTIFKLQEEKEKDLTRDDIEYLEELSLELKKFLNEYGEEGGVRIKEIVLDALLEDDKQRIIDYLNLNFDPNSISEIDKNLKDESYLKIESSDEKMDFFKSYLMDDTLDDLYYGWKGYQKKNEGSKQIFLKVRKCIIPNRPLNAIYTLLLDNFNKINMLSDKEDEEVGALILLTLDQVMEIISEIPYPCCDTAKTIELMSGMSLKMCNLIGYNKGNRLLILTTLEKSYQSKEDKLNRERNLERD